VATARGAAGGHIEEVRRNKTSCLDGSIASFGLWIIHRLTGEISGGGGQTGTVHVLAKDRPSQ